VGGSKVHGEKWGCVGGMAPHASLNNAYVDVHGGRGGGFDLP
jgi:hypothetical protein